MSLQPITSQIFTLEGVLQTEPAPGVYAQRAPSGAAGSREKETLFLHISVSGQLDVTGELLQTLVQAFVSRYFEQSGSLTAALRQSVDTVNGELRRYNKSAEVKRQGALTAAVLRGDELFMVQVGEVQAYLGHNFGLEPIPMEASEQITPLGLSTSLNPRFFHNWLQEGNLLLMADPRVAHWPKERFVTALVDSELLEAESRLTEMLSRSTARLLLATFHEGKAQFSDEAFAKTAHIVPPSDEVEDDPLEFEPLVAEEPFSDFVREAADEDLEIVDLEPIVADDNDDELELIPFEEVDEAEQIRRQRRARLRPADPVVATEAISTTTNIRANPVSRPRSDYVEQEPLVDAEKLTSGARRQTRKAAATGLRGMASGLRGMATVLNALRVPEQEKLDAPPRERFYAMLIAIFIPVLVAAVLISGLLQGNQRARISVIRSEINTALSAAQEAELTNPDEARRLYREVLTLSAEADQLVPNDTVVNNQRTSARDALDELDGVARLDGEVLYTYPEGTELTAIALGVDENDQHYIYTLDGANNIVYQHLTDAEYNLTEESPRAVLTIGEGVGTHIVGSMLDIVWKNANDNTEDAITVIDAKGSAISFYPTLQDKLASALPLSAEWGDPVALITYLGRLYVLDQGKQLGQGQMWRYHAKGNDFIINDDSRSLILPEMETAIDAAISIDDSSVLLLYENGRLHRYRDGRLLWDETVLVQQGLVNPLIAPNSVKIGGVGVRASIFVLDPASERIIEFSFAGVPLQEVRVSVEDGCEAAPCGSAEYLTNATDFAVVPNPMRLYIIAGNQLVVASH